MNDILFSEYLDFYMKQEGISNQELADTIKAYNEENYIPNKGFSCYSIRDIRHYATNNNLLKNGILEAKQKTILKALNLSEDKFTDYSKCKKSAKQLSSIATNPDDKAFSSILGTYYVYFYSTVKDQTELLQGTMTFQRESDDRKRPYCGVTFIIDKCDYVSEEKVFHGKLEIAKDLKACYIEIESDSMEERSYMLFKKDIVGDKTQYSSFVALCLTTAAKPNERIPTALKMFFSRKKIDVSRKENANILKGQLLFNHAQIAIKKSIFDKICEEFSVDVNPNASEEVVFVDEGTIRHTTTFKKLEKEKQGRFLCELRLLSLSERNSKVNSASEQILQKLFY